VSSQLMALGLHIATASTGIGFLDFYFILFDLNSEQFICLFLRL
jgi:hypothetical protein